MVVAMLHPRTEEIDLAGVLYALGDPVRLKIIETILAADNQLNCTMAAQQHAEMAKSTLSNHFRILREKGIIHMTKKGVENINSVRCADLEARFPGLLNTIMQQQTNLD